MRITNAIFHKMLKMNLVNTMKFLMHYFYMILLIGFLVVMLCFPTETFHGATSGLLLWFQTILPTLLPFMILSNLLIRTNCVYYISFLIRPLIQKLFHVSDNACYAVLIGFLCGYPMGAKVVADLHTSGRITRNEGQYLLSFCNNTSPMFIISYIVMQTFKKKELLLITLLILFSSPVLCSFIFRKIHHITITSDYPTNTNKEIDFNFQIFDDSIMNGFETITKVGGYMILFSILFTISKKLPIAFSLPLLEISNGIPLIAQLSSDFTIIYPYILGLTSFGGLCAVAQTNSMIQDTELRIFPYIIQKLVTALVTSLFAFLYVYFVY